MLNKYGFIKVSKTIWEGNGIKIKVYKKTFRIGDVSYPISKLDEVASSYVDHSKIDEEVLELMNRRERQIMVHSYIYYKSGTSMITDAKFDQWAYELKTLIDFNLREFKASVYYKDFKDVDFDGSTGYNLPYTYPEIVNKGEYLMGL